MRLMSAFAGLVFAAATTGCGLVDPVDFSHAEFGRVFTGFGCLEVTNDGTGGPHALVAVVFKDVVSHAVLRQEAVDLPPGLSVDLMDVPAGPYDVIGVYDDGYTDPIDRQPGYAVNVDPVVEATVTFHHP